MADDSYIQRGTSSTIFVGPDATKLVQATAVKAGIEFYLKTGMKLNRAYTPTNLLAVASKFSGKTYKRGRRGLAEAAADLGAWIAAMKAALPVVDKEDK